METSARNSITETGQEPRRSKKLPPHITAMPYVQIIRASSYEQNKHHYRCKYYSGASRFQSRKIMYQSSP